MLAPALVMLLFLAAVTVYGLFYYGDRRKITPAVFVIAFLGWYLPFSIVFLVPLDILGVRSRSPPPPPPPLPPCGARSLCIAFQRGVGAHQTQYRHCLAANQTCEEPIAYVSEEFLAYTWNINYWTSFILTWCGAPARTTPPQAHLFFLTHHCSLPCFLARATWPPGCWRRSCSRTRSRARSPCVAGSGIRLRRMSSCIRSSARLAPSALFISASPTR